MGNPHSQFYFLTERISTISNTTFTKRRSEVEEQKINGRGARADLPSSIARACCVHAEARRASGP